MHKESAKAKKRLQSAYNPLVWFSTVQNRTESVRYRTKILVRITLDEPDAVMNYAILLETLSSLRKFLLIQASVIGHKSLRPQRIYRIG